MVSIPDWNKISKFQEAQRQKQINYLERYYQQRDNEIIRQAEMQGYFVVPTKEFILKHCKPERKTKDLHKLLFVKLNGLHLRKPGELSYCVNVTICILSNNFLSKIDGLGACRHLIKLDVHSNQLALLPAAPFWAGLKKLRSLHLHDNPLARFDILHDICASPSLSILTLYDTPLFLKRNYRHHVVNSLWSLKALDNHVVSDEEIIEDAVFGPRFAAMAPQFRLNLCPRLNKKSSYKDELEALLVTEAKMNFLLSHFSPVLIIQRYVRGYLTRLKLSQAQRFQVMKRTSPKNEKAHPQQVSAFVPHFASKHESMPHFNSLIKLPQAEFDSQGEAGKVTERSTDSPLTPMNVGPSNELGNNTARSVPGEQTSGSPPGEVRNIFINLAKLHQETSQILQDEISAIELQQQQQQQAEISERRARSEARESRREKKQSSRPIIRSVKQFFGPVVDTAPSPVQEYRLLPDINDDLPITKYRICGFKPKISMIDATTEMILSRKEAGHLVRDAEADHHQRVLETPKPKIIVKKLPNTDQRLFNRVHGTMGMSCLFAVQKAYKEREKAEKTAAKMEHILTLRDEKLRAKERISLYREEKRSQVLRNRSEDRVKLLEKTEKHELDRLNSLTRQQDIKGKASEVSRNRRYEMDFVNDFNVQHTSVSNALMKHDRQARLDDQASQKFDLVQGHKSQEVNQQETVKKYLEHRQLMRQGETSTMRESLNAKLLQEANDRLFQSQQRVAQLKAKRDSIQAFYPLPPKTVPPTVSTAPPGMSRWEAGVLTSAGRIGRHPTMVT